jgi:hypothetical protein
MEQARETVERLDGDLHTPIMLMTVVMRLMKRLTLTPITKLFGEITSRVALDNSTNPEAANSEGDQ